MVQTLRWPELITNVGGYSLFEEYVDDIREGRKKAGKLVVKAVERFENDIKRQETGTFPYTFDKHKADAVISLFPTVFRHTVGAYAGSPFVLSPWQAFLIGQIWGWRCADGTRRFRRCYVSIARKNGKSTLAAAIAILLAYFDREPAAQVFIGATKQDQARLIYNEATRMIRKSKPLSEVADLRVPQINFPSIDSFIRPLGSDKAFDGLNPHGILFDELHAWKEQHRAFYDTLTTGSASRTQPLRFTITTAGDSNSLLWKEENRHAENIVNGEFADESYLVFVARIDRGDDPFDPENWYKAMPNLGVSVSKEYVQSQADEAQVSPMAKNRFIRYFANAEVSASEQAIDIDVWDSCQGELSDWKTADAICAGVDAGGQNDLGSWAACARFREGERMVEGKMEPIYRYEIRQWSYMDSDTSRDLNKAPWVDWIASGKLTLVPYVHMQLKDDLSTTLPAIGGRTIAFDPWSTTQMGEELSLQGFDCVKVQQTRFNMHEPLSMFLSLVEKGQIRHNGDPVLRWAVENLVINSDNNERWLPDRKESGDKIDPVVASIMALKMTSLARRKPSGPLYL